MTIRSTTDFAQLGKFAMPSKIIAMSSPDDKRIAILDDAGRVSLRILATESTTNLGTFPVARDAWQNAIKLLAYSENAKSRWLVVQSNRIEAFAEESEQSAWNIALNDGDSLVGQPVVEPGTLTLTLASGRIAKYALATGRQIEMKELDSTLAKPARAAKPFGLRKWIMPMLDGTVRVIDM